MRNFTIPGALPINHILSVPAIRFSLLIFLLCAYWNAFAQAPTQQAKDIVIAPNPGANVSTSLAISWTTGNGGKKIVVVTNSVGSFTPNNGQEYTQSAGNALAADGTADDKDPDGGEIATVVYVGTGNSVTVTGLAINNFFSVRVYEYNGATTTTEYNLLPSSTNPVRLWFSTNTTTTNTTPGYVTPSGVNGVTVQAWGGGGAGGGVNGPGNTVVRAGGGGSGGGYNKGISTATGTVSVTVGGGGAGASQAVGGAGKSTTFGTVTATGGNGGQPSTSDAERTGVGGVKLSTGNITYGGAGQEAPPGGTTTDATASGTGGGGPGISADGNNGSTGGAGGTGGGGAGVAGISSNGAGPSPGNNNIPGGGGAGAYETNNNVNVNGGDGAGGMVIVSFSIPSMLSASINYGTGVLTVTSSESIPNSGSVDLTKFFISNTSGANTIALTGATIGGLGSPASSFTITLTETQRQSALAISGTPGGDAGAAFLDVTAGGVTNAEGNKNFTTNGILLSETADTIAPTVLTVSSSTANGTYKVGSPTISITVTFSEIVVVNTASGTPSITIETNTQDAVATYSSGSNSTTLTFDYIVQAGDGDNGVTDISEIANSLALNLGTIRDKAGNDATLTHPGGQLAASKDIKIDTQGPSFGTVAPATSATVTSAIVSYTPSETLASGAITWTRVSGNADSNSPHTVTLTGTELNTSAKNNIILTNNPTNLVNGTVYDVAFSGTDALGNPGSVTSLGVTYNDNSAPGGSTAVGAVTVTNNGRVVLGYFNNTNTSIDVVVPLSNTDPTLDGGKIQIQVQNTGNPGFVDVPNSGLYTIVAADRIAGTKTVTVLKADLLLAVSGMMGFAEGAVNGLLSSETSLMEVTAVVKDNNNNSTTYTKSTNQFDVDLTAPSVVGNIFTIYPGSSATDAVQFQVDELLSDHAGSPAERIHNFQFIGATTNYSTPDPGISVGAGTTNQSTNNVRYLNDGAANTLNSAITNTRIIFVQSVNSTANWGVATGTKIKYTPVGTGSSAASVMRDAAGNEMAAFDVLVSAAATTTVGAATNGVLANSSTVNTSTGSNQTVFGFSLAVTGSTLNLTDVSIIPSVNVSGLLKNFRLFKNDGSDNRGTASIIGAFPSPSSPTTSIDFTGTLSLPVGTYYFYLVADLENYFTSTDPQVSFSMAASALPNITGGIGTSIGIVAGSTQNRGPFTLHDNIQPTVLSVTRSSALVHLSPPASNAQQTVTVVYSEPMNTATAPGITFPIPGNWTGPTGAGWSTTTLTGDTYTATFTNTSTNETNATATASVAVNANGTDWGGNKNSNTVASSNFVIDTQRPTVSTITRSLATVNVGANVQRVTVRYGESMNTGTPPTINFSSGSWGAAVPVTGGIFTGGWGTTTFTNDTYAADFTATAGQAQITGVTANANGGVDANGNTQTAVSANTAAFVLDTQRPAVTSITRGGNAQFASAFPVQFTVVFSESVTGVSGTDFNLNTTGTLAGLSIAPGVTTGDNITWVVTVNGGTGEGDVRLDVNGGTATINDNNGNALNVSKTGDEVYSFDVTPPNATAIDISSPVVTWTNYNGTSSASITWLVTFDDNVTGVDDTDFTIETRDINPPPSLAVTTPSTRLTYDSPPIISGSGATRTVTVNNVKLAGFTAAVAQIKISILNDDGTIKDLSGNQLSTIVTTGFTGNDYYSILFPEADAASTAFVGSNQTAYKFDLSWTNNATIPTSSQLVYWIDVKNSSIPSFNLLTDGTYTATTLNETDFSDGRINFLSTTPSATIPGAVGNLTSGANYDVRITPATLAGVDGDGIYLFDFRTSDALTVLNGSTGAYTTVGATSTMLINSTPVPISSLMDGLNGAVPDNTLKASVMQFQIFDDGQNSVTQTYNTPGSYSFTVPAGVTQITVEAWGAGGAGGSYAAPPGCCNDGPSGAGGGAYSSSVLPVVPGNSYTVIVGAGGTPINAADGSAGGQSSFGALVTAPGGQGGRQNIGPPYVQPGGAGGSIGTGDITFFGGSGAYGQYNNGGTGGGSSAGPGGNGTSGPSTQPGGYAGAIAPAGGGNGGTGSFSAPAGAGQFPGGGGSGGNSTVLLGGIGGNGQVKVSYGSTIDNAPFKFNQLIVRQGTGNAVADWRTVLAGAELTDGTTTIASDPIAGGTGAEITFSSLPSTNNGQFGFIPDLGTATSSKTYTLKVWLKQNMGGLATTIDNTNLAFRLDPSDVIPNNDNNQASSLLSGSQLPLQSGVEQIQVNASKLDFVINPPVSALVLTNLSTTPQIQARDANNNVDKDYNTNLTVTSPAAALVSSTSIGPGVNGVFTFPASFQFTDQGSFTLQVAGPNTPTSPTINSNPAVSSVITNVNYTSTSTITAGALNNLTINSTSTTLATRQDVFEFIVVDDGGPGLGDGAATRISQIVINQGPTNANTITDWTQVIQGARLRDNLGNFMDLDVSTTPGAFTPTSITFTGIPTGNGALGHVADNATASKTYTLSIYLKPSNAIPATLDGKNLTFNVNNSVATNFQAITASSQFAGGQSQSSTLVQNNIQVCGTQLRFIAGLNLGSPTLALKDISLQQSTPQLEVTDANGNRDLGYNSANINLQSTPAILLNPGGANPITISASSGIINFPNNFQFRTTGTNVTVTVSVTASSSTGCAATTPSVISNTINVTAGQATKIVAGAAPSPMVPSIANNSASAVTVLNFSVSDDLGAVATNNDGLPTLLNDLTFTPGSNNQITVWNEAIAGAELWSGATSVAATPANITAAGIKFSGLLSGIPVNTDLGYVQDDSPKLYSLKIYLKTNMAGLQNYPTTIDGKQFDFEILEGNINLAANSTKFVALEKTSSGLNKDVVDVAPTHVRFTQQPPASIGTFTTFSSPGIVVEVQDVNGNRDTDYNGAIGTVTNNGTTGTGPSSSLLMSITAGGSPTGTPTGNFTNGVYDFLLKAPNFMFVEDSGPTSPANIINLTVNTGGLIAVASAGFTVSSSYDSYIYFDPNPTFAPTSLIDFVTAANQGATPSASSQTIGTVILSDGGGPISTASPGNPTPTNFKNKALSHNDTDGAFTKINGFTITLTNDQDVQALRLFASDGTTPITGAVAVTSSTVAFNGLSGYPAPDGGIMTFVVKATFKPTITMDRDKLDMQIASVSWNSGSQFAEQLAAYSATHKGGISGGDTDPDGPAAAQLNRLDVIATQLDFVTQPSVLFAGINEPIGNSAPATPYATPPLTATTAGVVHARDKFGNLDLQISGAPSDVYQIAGHTTVNNVPSFSAGILTLDGIEYKTTGDGTLVVELGSLSSANPPSIACSPVSVIHVVASYPSSDPTIIQGSGSPPTYSIKGGSASQVIFGVRFDVAGQTASEPDLKSFSIVFDKSFKKVVGGVTTDIFENFVVKEGSNDITGALVNGKLVYSSTIPTDEAGSLNKITVNLKNNPRPISDGLTYYLIADVNSSASISTPDLTPTISDLGFTSLATDTTMLTSYGTAITTDVAIATDAQVIAAIPATLVGNKYTFASTRPPKLITAKNKGTSPYPGQLNVDPATSQIKLAFDVKVNSLDGGLNNGAELFRRYDNVKVADLKAVGGNGNYLNTNDYHNVVNPLTYDINFIGGNTFKNDTVYYVKIKKGSFDPINLTGTGISDEGLNFYGGIQDNATLYFKIASNKPIKLQNIASPFNNTKLVSLSTNFDQFGTAYYIVAPSGSTAPTVAQLLSPASYLPKVASGKYDITQINALQTETFPTNVPLTAGNNYDIYVYAENDALPTPVSAGGVYGTNKVAGSGGATLTIKAVNSANNTPSYLICSGSFVYLSEPIILGESAVGDFKKVGTQDVNILLPNGYEFDRSVKPSIQLVGTDFDNPLTLAFDSAKYQYISNTILNIEYWNNPAIAITTDYIVISNLRVKGVAGSSQLPIARFYGTNTFTPSVGKVATIGLKPTSPFGFTNSYSIANPNFPPPSPTIVNAIPDNYIDQDQAIAGSIRLFPNITVKNDYNSSTFSGSGVTGELLTLNAVSTDVAFDISMKHTDPNGCILEKTEQYVVYDHIAPISIKLGNSYEFDPDPLKKALAGTTQAIVNSNFLAGAPSGSLTSPTLLFNEKASYKLLSLTADLPETEKRLNLAGRKSQIISGPDWLAQVQKIVSAPMPINDPPFGTYNQYTWDYSHILNASFAQPTITTNPYDGDPTLGKIFQQKTSSGKTYWTGGSLGNVEFTGVYRSIADLSVVLPFRQTVELFVPPVPVIELNTVATDSLPDYPTVGDITLLYCEYGGAINITGFPNASAVSKGKFTLSNLDDTPIAESGGNYTGSGNDEGFKDNGNGTAILYPFKIVTGTNRGIINNYQDIKITYTFQENNSPAQGSGSVIIRITPNPKANFDLNSLVATSGPMDLNSIPDPKGGTIPLTVNALSAGRPIQRKSFCEGSTIYFDENSSWPTTGYSVAKATWDFGDNTVKGSNTTRDAHTYTSYGKYNVSLTVQSVHGCTSLDSINSTPTTPVLGATTIPIYVGAIPTLNQSDPNADIVMNGISTATPINVRRINLGLPIGATGTNYPASDTLTSLWHFGDPFVGNPDPALGTVFAATNKHTYLNAGHYKLTLLQKTNIKPTAALPVNPGCERSVQRDVIIVPAEPLQPVGSPYLNPFTTNGGWQIDDGLLDSVKINPGQKSTWKWGNPSTVGYPALSSNSGGPTGWFTGFGGKYQANERSYLFTSAYNFQNMSRPMLSFDQFTQTLQNDGVALDFSIDDLNVADPKKVWYRLGKQGEGSDWYNRSGLASKPGAQTEYPSTQPSLDFGWTETVGASGAAWVNSRLSITPAIPINKPIIFRFTLSVSTDALKMADPNTNTSLAKGIAIDNFRFGERTRIVIVENFTNATKANGKEKQEADYLIGNFTPGTGESALQPGVDYVKLNYHVGFPAQDPFNLDNSADPSARALYYGVASTPNARMDGLDFSTQTLPYLSNWGRVGYNARTLDLAGADINFDSAYTKNGAYRVKVTVTAKERISDSTYLHIVLAEKGLINLAAQPSGETGFEYVVRRMLPSATGRKFTKDLIIMDADLTNDTIQFKTVSWLPEKLNNPVDDMVAIAFLQDEKSKEILQAKMVSINDPTGLITGLESPFEFKDISIYPNPADQELNIVFPNALEVDVPIVMADQMGRITHQLVAKKGEQSVVLKTDGVSQGLYILQLNLGEGKLGRAKVIVNHKE